jgi:(2Fe-2S) ferredoxin
MRKFSILLALMLVALAVFPAAAQEAQVALTLERTACFGACPVYTVTVYTDGTVVYNGERFVDVEGEQTTTIDPETVEQLVAGFEGAGYFEWDDEYTEMFITDLPTVITSITRDGETKQITRYAGDDSAPLALPYLETWLDLAANTGQWTGEEVFLTGSTGMNSPVITLERTPCFGMCPVYIVSIFEDGTVIYIGINHVAVTGVQTSSIEQSELDWLVQEMELSGYFEWQDEYTHMLVTDQPTVITSISTEDNYKRITRYDGDPNAPVGLLRFEDRIDRVVNTAQWVTGSSTASE